MNKCRLRRLPTLLTRASQCPTRGTKNHFSLQNSVDLFFYNTPRIFGGKRKIIKKKRKIKKNKKQTDRKKKDNNEKEEKKQGRRKKEEDDE